MSEVPLIDLNCDLGEGFPDDERLIPLVHSVNVACGGHAGDDDTMRRAVRAAKAHGVNVGAHPGYEDRANFGRAAVVMTPAELEAMVERQLIGLWSVAAGEGVSLTHLKPHGALYHAADRDAAVADAVTRAMAIDPTLALVGPPGGELERAAARAGLSFVAEAFVDRRYRDDGTLVPRGESGAVIHDTDEAVRQAIGLAFRGRVTTRGGREIAVRARTLCVHGDGAAALPLLTAVRHAFVAHGVVVRSLSR